MKKTIGHFAKVNFPEFNLNDVTAKIDTGAYTGALHCTRIHEEIEGGKRVLYFSPFDDPKIVNKTMNFEFGNVRSSNGEEMKRYFIETSVVLQKHRYTITLSLVDRSRMKWPVLIGRRFLRANEFVVDVSRNNK